MKIQELKYQIIRSITEIDNLDTLEKIKDSLIALQPETVNNVLLQNNKSEAFNHREDFTDYIKEWVKEM